MSDDTPTVELPAPTTPKQRRAVRQVRKAFGVDTPEAADADFHLDTNGAEPTKPADMVTIKLTRNYRPGGHYEVVGYWQDEILRKDPVIPNKMHVVQPREFIPGVIKPADVAGTGYPTKLWAGTVIRLPKDEARRVRDNDIGEVEIE